MRVCARSDRTTQGPRSADTSTTTFTEFFSPTRFAVKRPRHSVHNRSPQRSFLHPSVDGTPTHLATREEARGRCSRHIGKEVRTLPVDSVAVTCERPPVEVCDGEDTCI